MSSAAVAMTLTCLTLAIGVALVYLGHQWFAVPFLFVSGAISEAAANCIARGL